MAIFSLLCFGIASSMKQKIVSDSFEQKLAAARLMAAAMDSLKQDRLRQGYVIDVENDPNETGLVGAQFSLITTDEGDLDAKLTTLDPNFATALVELYSRLYLGPGDTIAVLMTGSMPGGNMAALIAAKIMGITPVAIASVGASQWGANQPDFTWLDMEQKLYHWGFIPSVSIAASIGGRNDQGRLLSPRGRKIIVNTIQKYGLPLIRHTSLEDNIRERLNRFQDVLPLEKYSAVVNVGGGVASLGTNLNPKLIPPGIVRRPQFQSISRPDGIPGVLYHFAEKNVPVIHILNIRGLTEKLKMPFAPIPLPEIGTGQIYAETKYDLVATMVAWVLVVGMVFGVGYRSHKQIRQRMEQHEPDSVL
ncbi:MAG: poly-gamma-glutamate system protein [Candidatus Neomarinimicrobiota bacterium]|nr:MAG: poly-gamma-glutamate system protein [Candidatus Neomarinimicrobiota bacterium]